MGGPSCLRSAGPTLDPVARTATTSRELSPQSITHNEQGFHPSILSEPPSETVTTIKENAENLERSFPQDRISRVRLNGSHHTSNSSLNDSNIQTTDKTTAKAPEAGIISEFFSHSRLHHISTWRNEFSEYVNALQSRRRADGGTVFSGKEKLKKLRANRYGGNVIASDNYALCMFLELR